MLDPHFVFIGSIFNLFGSVTYAIDTVKGKTHPNRVTWFLWALVPLIAFFAELSDHVGLQSVMTLMVGVGPLIVFVCSFLNRTSVFQIGRFDLICGAFSLFALILWRLTGHGNLAIALSIVADVCAAVPTLRKAWTHPETESTGVYRNGSISAVITLLTIRDWTFARFAFPLYIFLACAVMFFLVKTKIGTRRKQSRDENVDHSSPAPSNGFGG